MTNLVKKRTLGQSWLVLIDQSSRFQIAQSCIGAIHVKEFSELIREPTRLA
jgi:hypothetical protein